MPQRLPIMWICVPSEEHRRLLRVDVGVKPSRPRVKRLLETPDIAHFSDNAVFILIEIPPARVSQAKYVILIHRRYTNWLKTLRLVINSAGSAHAELVSAPKT